MAGCSQFIKRIIIETEVDWELTQKNISKIQNTKVLRF
jgi:hypothetical protein